MNKLLLSASVALGATSLSFAQQTEKPNFLLFIADDCSHYDLGCYGSVDSKTPNIDRFATQEYVSRKLIRLFRCRHLPVIIYIPVCGQYVAALTPIILVPIKEH